MYGRLIPPQLVRDPGDGDPARLVAWVDVEGIRNGPSLRCYLWDVTAERDVLGDRESLTDNGTSATLDGRDWSGLAIMDGCLPYMVFRNNIDNFFARYAPGFDYRTRPSMEVEGRRIVAPAQHILDFGSEWRLLVNFRHGHYVTRGVVARTGDSDGIGPCLLQQSDQYDAWSWLAVHGDGSLTVMRGPDLDRCQERTRFGGVA